MSVVIDSSVTLAWLFDDEGTAATRHVFDLVVEHGAWVPSLWRLEVANILQSGVRRNRIDAAHRDASLADLAVLNIQIDPETNQFAWSSTLRLADRLGLTAYDAAYLELAQRRMLPLATLDKQLGVAARTIGVPVLGIDL
ncbi:MAG: type II toxin-antitoxin system VapC family toxin [Burkholderiaceae bacterium]